MSKEPLVSVIVCTLNSERYLRAALESVRGGGLCEYEVLVVDGGSTDSTVEIARAFPRTSVISATGANLPKSWNLGVSLARGEFITFLDSDDVLTPNSLLIRFDALNHSNKAALFGRVEFFIDGPNTSHHRPSLFETAKLAYMPGTCLLRRRLFENVGFFQEHFNIASDIEWASRIKETTDLIEVAATVLRKRMHENNLSMAGLRSLEYESELLAILSGRLCRE